MTVSFPISGLTMVRPTGEKAIHASPQVWVRLKYYTSWMPTLVMWTFAPLLVRVFSLGGLLVFWAAKPLNGPHPVSPPARSLRTLGLRGMANRATTTRTRLTGSVPPTGGCLDPSLSRCAPGSMNRRSEPRPVRLIDLVDLVDLR